MKTLITAVSKAVESGMHAWALHLKSADKRRARRCIDAAESYILINKDKTYGPNVKSRKLAVYEKRFWRYNQ